MNPNPTAGAEETPGADPALLAESPASGRAAALRDLGADLVGRYGMLVTFLVAVAVLLIASSDFRNPTNLLNILQQNAMIGVVACGMLVVIITGGFDLSVGAIGAASSVAAASAMTHYGIAAGIAVAVAVGLMAGVFNGLLVAKIGITPFVATLGSSVLITGILFAQTDAKPITGLPESLSEFGFGKTAGVPNTALVFAGVVLVTFALLRYARWGHYAYAIGSNPEASRLAGLPVKRVVIAGYAIAGITAGIAGILLLSSTGIGQPNSATGWALTAIAAVVVGGTPLRGGIGGVHSAVVGTLMLGVLSNALTIYGISPYWQPAATGAVILLTVGFDSYRRSRRGGVA